MTRHLHRLGAAYPAFNFSYAMVGGKGRRWTTERRDRASGGLIVVITGDLLEMHAALARYKETGRGR